MTAAYMPTFTADSLTAGALGAVCVPGVRLLLHHRPSSITNLAWDFDTTISIHRKVCFGTILAH